MVAADAALRSGSCGSSFGILLGWLGHFHFPCCLPLLLRLAGPGPGQHGLMVLVFPFVAGFGQLGRFRRLEVSSP